MRCPLLLTVTVAHGSVDLLSEVSAFVIVGSLEVRWYDFAGGEVGAGVPHGRWYRLR